MPDGQLERRPACGFAGVPPRREPAASANGQALALVNGGVAEGAIRTGERDGGANRSVTGLDALARMDAGAEVSASRTAPAGGPRSVEVGINDPAHGWIEVRAQGGSGQVSASLRAASPEAHAALDAQLPAMTQYLAEREVGVHALEVRSSDGSGGFPSPAHPSESFTGGHPGHSGSGAGPGQGFGSGSGSGANAGSGGSGGYRGQANQAVAGSPQHGPGAGYGGIR